MSPYLPLNLEPEIERQIERVLILADKPVMARPIAAATVFDALPKACESDEALCKSVEAYLQRYMRRSGVTRLRGELAATSGDSQRTLPNSHGMSVDSAWEASAEAYFRMNDYISFNIGGVAYDGDFTPTGTMLSMGWDFAQIDVGWRDHWLSPFTDSSMLISTEATTMPSITISNYQPFRLLGFQYAVFLAEMSHSDHIGWQGGYTSGNPRLAGLHLQIEPTSGYALSANRVMQFGGGARGGKGFNNFLKALFKPHNYDNYSSELTTDEEFGNQVASLASRLIFPAKTPFAVYFEYAGEDASYDGNYRIGNASLSAGIDFPRLWNRIDLTFETTEWQNGWYIHHVYQDGLTNEGKVIGHWFGDERESDVGGSSQMIRAGWSTSHGYAQLLYRTLENRSYSAVNYSRLHEISASYAFPWAGHTVAAELGMGRDVFGDSYARLAASFSLQQNVWGTTSVSPISEDSDAEVELFVDGGANVSKPHWYLGDSDVYAGTERNRDAWRESPKTTGAHVGVGARRRVTEHGDLGARLELDDIDGRNMISVRAIDYRYRLGRHFALGGFFGAGRYDLATPAYGYYFGVGLQWRDVLPGFDLNIDGRHYEKVARDKVLPSDPSSQPRNDMFYDIDGAAMYLSWRF